MAQVICPSCGTMIDVSQHAYAELLQQVRTQEFERELSDRMEAEQKLRQQELALAAERMETRLEAQRTDYEARLRDKDEIIAYYKDLKARQSTKMVGESLEQHCQAEFEKVRALGFRNSYFEKDNAVSATGSKGDFIYREYDDDGMEVVSIMFEMKAEMESTAEKQKHKNENFFKELDKDRREKKCEYAVLVSLLELDSELYNQGIVDVSHRYDKMYVIRPQFMVPLITLIRNEAMRSVDYRHELEDLRSSSVDLLRLESDIEDFKAKFGKNATSATEKIQGAIDGIDKTIAQLEKIKASLMTAGNQVRLAGDKADKLVVRQSIKKRLDASFSASAVPERDE